MNCWKCCCSVTELKNLTNKMCALSITAIVPTIVSVIYECQNLLDYGNCCTSCLYRETGVDTARGEERRRNRGVLLRHIRQTVEPSRRSTRSVGVPHTTNQRDEHLHVVPYSKVHLLFVQACHLAAASILTNLWKRGCTPVCGLCVWLVIC